MENLNEKVTQDDLKDQDVDQVPEDEINNTDSDKSPEDEPLDDAPDEDEQAPPPEDNDAPEEPPEYVEEPPQVAAKAETTGEGYPLPRKNEEFESFQHRFVNDPVVLRKIGRPYRDAAANKIWRESNAI